MDVSTFRILIIEDNADNARVLSELLALVGLQFRVAEDGALGVSTWHTWQPHLVLMDLRLPILDGVEATRRMRKAGATIPIIGVTANVSEAVPDGELFSAILSKPIVASRLYELLEAQLGVELEYEVEPTEGDGGPRLDVQDLRARLDNIRDGAAEALDELEAALRAIDPDRIWSALNRVATIDAGLSQLFEWADEYRYEELLDLLKEEGNS